MFSTAITNLTYFQKKWEQATIVARMAEWSKAIRLRRIIVKMRGFEPLFVQLFIKLLFQILILYCVKKRLVKINYKSKQILYTNTIYIFYFLIIWMASARACDLMASVLYISKALQYSAKYWSQSCL